MLRPLTAVLSVSMNQNLLEGSLQLLVLFGLELADGLPADIMKGAHPG